MLKQVSGNRNLWLVLCTCDWTSETDGRKEAIALREKHLDECVTQGAALRGGGREAPTGPWKNPPQPRREKPTASA